MNQPLIPLRPRARRQRGGFAVGLIIGLLIGLGLALGVALYVEKVPVPFLNKVPQRTAGQDAAEAEKNKNWDPNSPLYGKNPARPNATSASGVIEPPPSVAPPTAVAPAAPAVAETPAVAPATRAAASAAAPARDPAAILTDRAAETPALKGFSVSTAASGPDPFNYFVQAGAYSHTEDAEQQRAKLAMMGLEGKLSERDQAGHTVYRVRLGPFAKRVDADAAKEVLSSAGIDAALVRVQR